MKQADDPARSAAVGHILLIGVHDFIFTVYLDIDPARYRRRILRSGLATDSARLLIEIVVKIIIHVAGSVVVRLPVQSSPIAVKNQRQAQRIIRIDVCLPA